MTTMEDLDQVCTPVLKHTGQRLLIRHPIFEGGFRDERGPGKKGIVQDAENGRRYLITGKPCDIDTCHCDAWAEEI
jgi:hypothetical protein